MMGKNRIIFEVYAIIFITVQRPAEMVSMQDNMSKFWTDNSHLCRAGSEQLLFFFIAQLILNGRTKTTSYE